jgi:adenylate kinase family enzyme
MISLKSVRRAGVPLVIVETGDPQQTIQSIIKELNGKDPATPFIAWDFCRGVKPLNEPGLAILKRMPAEGDTEGVKQATQHPNNLVQWLDKIPKPKNENEPLAVVFVHNAQLYWRTELFIQGVWNLRDTFKGVGATLVMLCPSALSLPMELKNDTVVLTDTLPTEEEIDSIIESTLKDADLKPDDVPDKNRIADALLGSTAFGGEQILSMSLKKDGVDLDELGKRRIRMIEQTRGLSVHRGKEMFRDIGGLRNGKEILSKTITGKSSIRAIVFLDEIDKGMAASGTDTSGTTQDQLKVLLTYMQDNGVLGVLLNGPPGTGKTILCKAAGNEHNIPMIMLDLGGMKEKFVGSSEDNLREAIKVIHAITGGQVLFVGACNRTDNIPPELRRRFNYCSLFVDLPDEEERAAMWKIHLKARGLTDKRLPDDANWTGAEIYNCCLKSWAMDVSLVEAAKSIVPVAVSDADRIQTLRKAANGKYISASRAEIYTSHELVTAAPTGRRMGRE